VLPLDTYQTGFEESGGGINSQNGWWLDACVPRVQAGTGHGPFAIAEAAEVRVVIHSTFQPPSPDATLTWDVSWSGFATSFVGADSSAQARIIVRVYELIAATVSTPGPVVFERVVEDDGVGSALQGVATLRMDGSDFQTVVLPPLDPDKIYRVEAELQCKSRVAFSVGATVCAFAQEATSGLTVNDWSLSFSGVPT
jgi:hypothetical protein